MSALLEITEKLQDTQAVIRQLEQALAQQTPTPSVIATLNSLQKRQGDLEARFAEAAFEQHLDVCSYRLFPDRKEEAQPSLRAFTKTLLDFQYLFTQVYDVIKGGQTKERTRVTAEVAAETAFGFGYTFTGSLGAVLTLPNERLLIGETEIDRTIATVFELVKAGNTEQIAAYAKELGRAPIRTLYNWVSDQVAAGLSSQIEWRRKQEVRTGLLVQFPELVELKRAIEATSDEEEETHRLTGMLVGIDLITRSFHMSFEKGKDIRGKMAGAIGAEHTVEVGRVYTAQIIKTKKILYSTDKETVFYFLVSLD